jgi:hypothetical protein
MRTVVILLLATVAFGCKRTEPMAASSPVADQKPVKPDAFLDMKHLPEGAVRHEIRFKKGETLPDGHIAEKDTTLVRIEVLGRAPR